jgi:hypothetical protein
LAGHPDFRTALGRFRLANRAHLIQIRDTGFYPEAMMIAEAKGASPALVASDVARYPIALLLELVDGCQLEPRDTRALEPATRDSLPVFRCWSAICALSAVDPPDLNSFWPTPTRVSASRPQRRSSGLRTMHLLGNALPKLWPPISPASCVWRRSTRSLFCPRLLHR